jgi:CspA family cold shock protein
MKGVVRAYDTRRGVGAIAPDRGGEDIPVHVSEVERAGFTGLDVGERLSFDVQTDRALGRSFAVNLARG